MTMFMPSRVNLVSLVNFRGSGSFGPAAAARAGRGESGREARCGSIWQGGSYSGAIGKFFFCSPEGEEAVQAIASGGGVFFGGNSAREAAMKAAAAAMAAAALLGGSAAEAQQRAQPTQAELFCHDLKRVVKTANHESQFEHLERSRAAPPWLGFRPGGCRAYAGRETAPAAWDFHQHLAPPRPPQPRSPRRGDGRMPAGGGAHAGAMGASGDLHPPRRPHPDQRERRTGGEGGPHRGVSGGGCRDQIGTSVVADDEPSSAPKSQVSRKGARNHFRDPLMPPLSATVRLRHL